MDERERALKDEITGVGKRNSRDTGQQRAPRAASGETTVTRRSFLAAVGGAASVAAVPAARAASENGYGQNGYGAGTYGGV